MTKNNKRQNKKKRGEFNLWLIGYRAYGYQYETSPKKLQPEYEPNKNPYKKKKSSTAKKAKTNNNKKVSKKAVTKTKKKTMYNYKPIVYIGIVFAMLFTISYRNSLINEGYNEKENIKSQLSAVQKENEQLRVSIENSLNLNSVEKSAEEKLGMQKLDNNQKIYLNLQKKDYVEPASEEIVIEEELSWFEEIIKKLTQIIK